MSSRAAPPHGAADDALGESVRSTAVDLMRAAELVTGDPDELPGEDLLLGLARHDDRLRTAAAEAEQRDSCPFVATFAEPAPAAPRRPAARAL